MSISTAEKAKIVGEYQQAQNDTGSPEVQVALLSSRINMLTEHFKIACQGSPFPSWSAGDGKPTS